MPPERPQESPFPTAYNTHTAGMPLICEETPQISIITAKSINIPQRTFNPQNRKLQASSIAISIISIISPENLEVKKILYLQYIIYINKFIYIIYYLFFESKEPTFQVKLLKLLKSSRSHLKRNLLLSDIYNHTTNYLQRFEDILDGQ